MEPTLTYGEKMVGITFNHATGQMHDDVQEIKVLAAAQIDLLDAQRKQVVNPSEKGALLTHAIRAIMDAQMWAVKARTFPVENGDERS